MNKEIVLYGEQEGFINSWPTLWDAYYGWQEVKRTNKEFKIPKDKYYWQFEYDKDGFHYEQEIKFYVRNGKMFYKLL